MVNVPISLHLHCLTSGQISSLFYLSDQISELCRRQQDCLNLHSNILDHVLVTAQGQHPSHHLHELQARSALCFISLIKSLNLHFAGSLKYFAAHHGRPNLKAVEAQVLHTPVRSAHSIASWGLCC
jgi:hypothetical protein